MQHSDCLALCYQDNKSRLDDIELGEIVVLYKHLCSCTDKDLLHKILPILEIPANTKHLDRMLTLAALHQDIKDAFYNELITQEQVGYLSELSDFTSGTIILMRILLPFKLNTNESRQVIRDIEEITLRDKRNITDLIDELLLRVGDNGKKNDLRREIKNIRYPALNKAQREYDVTVKDMNLPDEVKIFVNQFFEANDIEIRVKVKSGEQLKQILSDIDSSCDSGDLDKLISIVREGSST